MIASIRHANRTFRHPGSLKTYRRPGCRGLISPDFIRGGIFFWFVTALLFTIYITAANYLIKISQKGLDAIRLSVKLSFMFVKYLTESEESPQARIAQGADAGAGVKTCIRELPPPLRSGLVRSGLVTGGYGKSPQARSVSAGAKTGIRELPPPLRSGLVTGGACVTGGRRKRLPTRGPGGLTPFLFREAVYE